MPKDFDYICKNCKTVFSEKSSLTNHLKRKTKCSPSDGEPTEAEKHLLKIIEKGQSEVDIRMISPEYRQTIYDVIRRNACPKYSDLEPAIYYAAKDQVNDPNATKVPYHELEWEYHILREKFKKLTGKHLDLLFDVSDMQLKHKKLMELFKANNNFNINIMCPHTGGKCYLDEEYLKKLQKSPRFDDMILKLGDVVQSNVAKQMQNGNVTTTTTTTRS